MSKLESSTSTKRKCDCCNKKLGIVAFPCKCGGYYCPLHRYDTEHNCTYDYKLDFSKISSTVLVKVGGKKLESID